MENPQSNDETCILSYDVEQFLVLVLELDPGILIMSMDLLWKQWAAGKMLNIMKCLTKYYAKANKATLIFKRYNFINSSRPTSLSQARRHQTTICETQCFCKL